MEKYGKAWEKQDSRLILECFTKNGVYQENPLSKPIKKSKSFGMRLSVKKPRI